METATHSILGGKVQLFRRPGSSCWQARGALAGKQRQKSTGEESLAHAKDVATNWYLELTGKYCSGELKEGADIYQIAKNCRTSIEMIEKFYAPHINNTINAAAINVRRLTPTRRSWRGSSSIDEASL